MCAHCGYGMGRNSGTGGRGGLHLHYYRCYGTEHWRYAKGAVCDNPAVRAEDIDDAVWQGMLTLLEHPELSFQRANKYACSRSPFTRLQKEHRAYRLSM